MRSDDPIFIEAIGMMVLDRGGRIARGSETPDLEIVDCRNPGVARVAPTGGVRRILVTGFGDAPPIRRSA